MFPSMLLKCLALVTLFQVLNLVHLTNQLSLLEDNNHIDLKKSISNTRNKNDFSKHQDAYKVPFIVLMSADSISVAQLPLIENGNLTVVYRLIGGGANINDIVEVEDIDDNEDDENQFQTHGDSEIGEQEEEEVGSRRGGESGADVREYEQMPRGAISATIMPTASLGKSEWQQIATGKRNPEEALDQPTQTTATTSRKEEDAQEEAPLLPRRRRSPETSNSFLSLTDDDGNNRAPSNSNETGSAVDGTREENKREEKQQQQQPKHYSDQNEPTVQKTTNSKTSAEESSSSSNVTSAQFATDNEQPNLTATRGTGGTSAEEDDRNSQTQSGHDGSSSASSSSSSSSSLPPSFPSSQDVSSGSIAVGFGGLKFSDFDVHMSLGYAFVADSAGRIHRFRLLRESSSSSSGPTEPTHSTGTNRDDLLENDYTNTIEAGSKFEFLPQQSRISGGKKQQQSSTTRSSGTGSSASSDNAENEASSSSSFVNRVSSGRGSNDDVTHEQSDDERQHPAISGAGQQLPDTTNSDKLLSDAPISGSLQTKLNQQPASRQLKHISGAEPTIIWSRSKFRLPLAAIRAKSASKAKGALPSRTTDDHQVANETTRTSQRQAISHGDTAGHYHSGESGDESTNSDAKSAAQVNRRRYLPTQIAVDWLNNLIFVLDKYRLLVVDFDGNNELVLIDDFTQNNRPIDLKVDPINDFLFWLQVGKFHNTIYKLNLNILSKRSATSNLVGNTIKLDINSKLHRVSHSNSNNSTSRSSVSSNDDDGSGFDTSDLVALVSHHYAHPIITNLPRHVKLFTIDHKHSRIYVPLTPSPSVVNTNQSQQRDDAEIFALPSDNVTHLNNTESNLFESSDAKNCTTDPTTTNQLNPGANGQILAYNLDGTDVGPLRSVGDDSHITRLEDMQDITVDTEKNLLYWLTNGGKEIFEEYKNDVSKAIYPAQHHLDGKNYIKLIHFDNDGSNQPTGRKSRFNMRSLIQMLSNSIQPNRPPRMASSLNGRHNIDSDADWTRFSRNAPLIILSVTCLIVITVYLIYALIFQRVGSARRSSEDNHCGSRGDGSIGGGSSISGSHAGADSEAGTMFNTSTVSRWIGRPSGRLNQASNLDVNHVECCDLESTNYDVSNAIDEHYRGSTINHEELFGLDTSNRLANLSQWPTNMHDMSNKLYVPVEVLQDEALSSIHRVSIEQLEIERRAPLGEGHFGTVLQGTIKCSMVERTTLLNKSQACYMPPMSPDSLAPTSQHRTSRLPISSTGSSGHGSSSSTSYEFRTANNCTETATTSTNNGDYLTPKSHFNSASSDYTADNPASSEAESFSSYGNMSSAISHKDTKSAISTKLRVAIKKLKDNPSPDEKRDFLQEAKLLANFDHPNIVHLIGICLDRGSTLIVMELMLGGDLIRYMQENVPSVANNQADNLTYDDLLKICLDIVNGCCYLEELDYIHRDLAARNCLVSSKKREERVVKLADFGLARDIYKDSYYKKLNDSAMPLKWMAPECLIEQKFTKKSDVWSFGVVMWEVMSYCQEKPYGKVEPFFMREHLANGGRLRKPDCCDDDMYRLMNQCWQMDPGSRPTFHECRSMLIEIRNSR